MEAIKTTLKVIGILLIVIFIGFGISAGIVYLEANTSKGVYRIILISLFIACGFGARASLQACDRKFERRAK